MIIKKIIVIIFTLLAININSIASTVRIRNSTTTLQNFTFTISASLMSGDVYQVTQNITVLPGMYLDVQVAEPRFNQNIEGWTKLKNEIQVNLLVANILHSSKLPAQYQYGTSILDLPNLTLVISENIQTTDNSQTIYVYGVTVSQGLN